MDAERYLDFAHKYHALANTAVNFFSLVTIALIGWIVTISTDDSFSAEPWLALRWWLAGLYVALGLAASIAQSISARRANAAFQIARMKLLETEGDDRRSDIEQLTLPYQSRIIVAVMVMTSAVVGAGTVFLLGQAPL